MQLVHTVRCVDIGWGVAVEECEGNLGSRGCAGSGSTSYRRELVGSHLDQRYKLQIRVRHWHSSMTSTIAVNRVSSRFIYLSSSMYSCKDTEWRAGSAHSYRTLL